MLNMLMLILVHLFESKVPRQINPAIVQNRGPVSFDLDLDAFVVPGRLD